MTVARVAAAVDIGSNSVHLLVASVGTRLEPLLDESVQLGLGSIVDRAGHLAAEARALAVEAVRGYVDRARALGATEVTILGTEPLRRAADAPVLAAEVRAATGLELHVLAPASEAALTFLGATVGRPARGALLVVDIGGGSTEVVLSRTGQEPLVGTLATGSSRLATETIVHDPPRREEIEALLVEARARVATLPPGVADRGIVTGGTGSNTNRLVGRARLMPFGRGILRRATAELVGAPAHEIASARGLSERRVRQLPAGIAILEAVLGRYGLARVTPSDASIREGALVAVARAGDAWADELRHLIAA
jgi:exopolyphosphatase/guanosine-5'-triphosphate,3'-diphosphate pyrophosphatase